MTKVLAHSTVTNKHRGAVRKAVLRKDARNYLTAIRVYNSFNDIINTSNRQLLNVIDGLVK